MKILDYTGLQYLYGKLLARLNNKVDKVTGKGLSTNASLKQLLKMTFFICRLLPEI